MRIEDLQLLQEQMRAKREQAKLEKQATLHFRNLWRQFADLGIVPSVCKCGRDFDCLANLHCPACGSTNLIAAAAKYNESRNWTDQSGAIVKVLAIAHKCRRCSMTFTDMDAFANCEAPPKQPTMREIRNAEKVENNLKKVGIDGVEDFKRKLEEYRNRKKD